MKIALDFDETFSADVEFWRDFCFNAKTAGHEVRIVTARGASGDEWEDLFGNKLIITKDFNEDLERAIDGLHIEVIYCTGEQKRVVCSQVGWNPDIWIDDHPEAITEF